MAGVYIAVLCPRHRNEFHKFITLNPAYRTVNDFDEEMATLMLKSVRGEDVTEIVRDARKRLVDAQAELFDICEAWVNGGEVETEQATT
jgi:hypothetical protein